MSLLTNLVLVISMVAMTGFVAAMMANAGRSKRRTKKRHAVPYSAPYSAPFSVPHSVPYSEPYSTPYSAPYSVPYSVPHSTPYSVPYSTPYSAPQVNDGFNIEDYVVYTTATSDLPGNPMNGTMSQCKDACAANAECVAFSRPKPAADSAVSQCWLKRDVANQTKTYNDGYWQTVVKSTSA